MATSLYEELFFVDSSKPVWNYSLLSDEDVKNFQDGTHYSLYNVLGSKQIKVLNTEGTYFAVWAPSAQFVSVKGNFNEWDNDSHTLYVRKDGSGIWEGFIPNIKNGEAYKYYIIGADGINRDKGDPFAHFWEKRPLTASITWNLTYKWKDKKWMKNRFQNNSLDAPISIYEVHLASWARPDKYNEESYHTYDKITELLVPYVKEMGFTHVELMPVMEHPFDGSWGYQGTGFFAPTSRFGDPQGFMRMIDAFHKEEIGVILDWVPSHFPYDAHGLYMFDGEHTYEYADMRKGFHPDWNSYIFNYSRNEVRSFLISSARFWFDIFHIDGLRVDAVSSIIQLDYSREEGEWEPNVHGGNGNLEAIGFIKDLNQTVYRDFPDILMIAEEATDWPGVTSPTFANGLGFGLKWMMGWMHDTLKYFKKEPYFRQFHQDELTFSTVYYYNENFLLPLSHDEVVHGKSPMLYKMSGDEWQKFANLRLLYTYMYTHPGGKLLFMGNEFGATQEWNYKSELQWDLLFWPSHVGMKNCVQKLNELLKQEKGLYHNQFSPQGFEWIDLNHRAESIIVYKRKGETEADDLLIFLNMTPVPRWNWQLETYSRFHWKEIFNSDSKDFWGAGDVYNNEIKIESLDKDANICRIELHLPPLGAVILKQTDQKVIDE